ncbi:MAG: hypothetical protein ACLUOI_14870 [Eisenbergiella sp.]
MREAVCTREDPPGCTAACPLRLDMREVCAHAAKGDFAKAAGVIRSHALSVSAVRSMFRHVCGSLRAFPAGRRGTDKGAGESLCDVRRSRRQPVSASAEKQAGHCRRQRALCPGLLLGAGEKGYEIRWHTECSGLKEPLLCRGLTEEEASADLQSFSALKLTRTELEAGGEERFRKWAGQADAPSASRRSFSQRTGTEKPDCLKTVFASQDGGEAADVPWILAWAKYAAARADRYLQGASPDGISPPALQESRLYVTMDGVKGSRAPTEEKAPDRETAAAEAARCIGCQCLECVKGCAYLQHIKEIRGGHPGDLQQSFDRHGQSYGQRHDQRL